MAAKRVTDVKKLRAKAKPKKLTTRQKVRRMAKNSGLRKALNETDEILGVKKRPKRKVPRKKIGSGPSKVGRKKPGTRAVKSIKAMLGGR